MIKEAIPQSAYEQWIRPIVPVSLAGNLFTVEVPSHFFKEYLEEHFLKYISRALKTNVGPDVKLMYMVKVVKSTGVTIPAEPTKDLTNKSVTLPNSNRIKIENPFVIPGLQRLNIDSQLNSLYNFDSFVEGDCNRLARAAGLSISNSPGYNAYNPLFIYGKPGMGKTHLAQAIGIAVKEKFPNKIVLYVNANRFMTQFLDAVNYKKNISDFLRFYQMIDLLIVDDVQDFAEKQGTQNAFFHIFNHLQQSGKQLILTSDKPPVELKGLESRLLSRFKWGLSAELLPPQYDTRLAILKAKSLKDGIVLSNEILEYAAANVIGSVRELEGFLVSLIAHATLKKEDITIELAKSIIEKIVVTTNKQITLEKIQQTVCGYFGITVDVMLSKSRKREIVQARQLSMYLGRNFTKSSLSVIGANNGGKDHSTVLHACSTVQDLIATDKNFKSSVIELESQLRSYM